MAGSYYHAVRDDGKLRYYTFGELIENGGDAYEMAERMYGMIWFLAQRLSVNTMNYDAGTGLARGLSAAQWVTLAEQQWRDGISHSPGIEDE